jgi:ABC-2 type transport system ATP-binding protein
MEEAQVLADRIAVFAGGEIVAQGIPDEIGGRKNLPSRIEFRLPAQFDASDLPPEFRAAAGDDGFVSLAADDPTRKIHEITGWAIDRGVSLEDLAVVRPSLEDVYLNLTGNGDSGADQ